MAESYYKKARTFDLLVNLEDWQTLTRRWEPIFNFLSAMDHMITEYLLCNSVLTSNVSLAEHSPYRHGLFKL